MKAGNFGCYFLNNCTSRQLYTCLKYVFYMKDLVLRTVSLKLFLTCDLILSGDDYNYLAYVV